MKYCTDGGLMLRWYTCKACVAIYRIGVICIRYNVTVFAVVWYQTKHFDIL